MTREQLAKAITERALLKGSFKLRSGQTSERYFDKYRFESDPDLLQEITQHWKKMLPQEFDALAGLELGGVPLATALSISLKKPVLFVRKEAKNYGTCQFAEGLDYLNKKLLVIEDVITTGGQVFESVKMLRESGAAIDSVACVIDRGENTESLFNSKGLKLYSLFKMNDLVPQS